MIDLLGQVIDYLRLDSGAATLQTALGDSPETKITADFDPENVSRPYIVALQSHWDSKYKALGNSVRVENQIISFLCFTDTRADCVALLDTLESVLIQQTFGLGPPYVADKVAQLDLNKLDAYKGTLNLVWQVEQLQK